VSDALYNIKGKKVEVSLVDSDDIIEGLLVDADSMGFTIRGKDDDDNEFLGYYTFRQLIEMKMLLTIVPNPKKLESGLEIEDSDEMRHRLLTMEVEKAVAGMLGKDFEVSMDEDSIDITNADGETVIDGDYESLTVYDEASLETSKKIAVIIGAKKIARDYREE